MGGDDVLRHPLHVLGAHGVEGGEHLLRLGRPALERLAPESVHDQALRALELEHEATLRKAAGLLELLLGDRLLGDAPELADDRRHRLVDALDVDAGLRVERPGLDVAVIRPEDVVGEAAALAHLAEEA